MTQVILLNGASSAGKTTLALKLQQLLPEPFQYVSLDQFRDGMPERVRGLNAPEGSEGALGLNVVPMITDEGPRTRIEFGSYGQQVLAAMRETVARMASAGIPVVVDDLLFEQSFIQHYAEVLDHAQTWVIGVHCDAAILNQRESERLGRFPGTALEHMVRVHAAIPEYDLDVYTDRNSPREIAEQVIKRLKTAPRCLKAVPLS